jgi:hypothetical protein
MSMCVSLCLCLCVASACVWYVYMCVCIEIHLYCFLNTHVSMTTLSSLVLFRAHSSAHWLSF